MNRTLPLGIDIGATRLRVAEAYATPDGVRIRAVTVRESPSLTDAQHVAALLEDALRELGTRERRCVCGVGEPNAFLRELALPRMSAAEREHAARFEAARYIDFPIEDAVVRLGADSKRPNTYVLGVARASAIEVRKAALRGAGLRPLAIDHEAFALSRALPGYDAVLDVGAQRTTLHVTSRSVPVSFLAYNGGSDITQAIERDLSLDALTAEKRKRILGTAGAGERARAALVGDIVGLVSAGRSAAEIARVAITGNGSRLCGLMEDVGRACGLVLETPVSAILSGSEYPEDVAVSAAPDWTLAAGLTLWRHTA